MTDDLAFLDDHRTWIVVSPVRNSFEAVQLRL